MRLMERAGVVSQCTAMQQGPATSRQLFWGMTLLLLTATEPSSPAKILGLFAYKGASHFYTFRPLLEELSRRGHEVLVVSHLPRVKPLGNYTDISLVDPNEPATEFQTFDTFEKMESTTLTNLVGLKILGEGYEKALSNPKVLALANASYDLVITEMFNSDIFYGLIYRIGAPVIGFSSCQMMVWTSDSLGSPIDLPYIPHSIGAGRGPDMNFFERLINIIEIWISRLFYHFVINREAQAVAEKYLGPLPPLSEIASNTSLLFVNSHFTTLGHRPHTPAVIEVGGINVLPPKPLPKELSDIFDKSTGVIYFSMGSVLKGSSMSEEKQRMFINTFVQTGKTVLWKREDTLTGGQTNIITRPWFPQRDILAHPKTELFITHCGLLGLNEAVASGVPVICLPMFGDQPANGRFVQFNGIGLHLRFATLTEDIIRNAIQEVLNNKKYKERARQVSAAFNDRPMSPLQTAVYWTEYLLRHGPKPFQTPFRQLPLWQKLGLDIALTLLAVVSILIWAFSFVIKIIFCRNRSSSREKKVKEN